MRTQWVLVVSIVFNRCIRKYNVTVNQIWSKINILFSSIIVNSASVAIIFIDVAIISTGRAIDVNKALSLTTVAWFLWSFDLLEDVYQVLGAATLATKPCSSCFRVTKWFQLKLHMLFTEAGAVQVKFEESDLTIEPWITLSWVCSNKHRVLLSFTKCLDSTTVCNL